MTPKQIIARERRWAPFVGAAGVVAILAFLAYIGVNAASDVATADTVLSQFGAYQAGAGTFLLAQALQAIALTAVGGVTWFLYKAAQARDDRVSPAMVGFPILFPILFVVATVGYVVAFGSVSDDYAELPEAELANGGGALEKFRGLVEDSPDDIDRVLFLTEPNIVEYEPTDSSAISLSYPDADQDDLIDAVSAADIDADEIDSSEAAAGELRAQQFVEGAGSYGTFLAVRATNTVAPGLLILPATLALIVAVFYTARWALRTGLQTRFWGTFGMAGSIAVILLGPLGPLLWAFNAGLAYAGWPRGLQPRAWQSGQAEPWGAFEAEPSSDEADQPAGTATTMGTRRKRKQRR